jgi:hypothetical protein
MVSIFIILFLHGLGRLTCSDIEALSSLQSLSFSFKEPSQPNGVKPEMRGRKLRSGEYWQEALKQSGVKKFNVK